MAQAVKRWEAVCPPKCIEYAKDVHIWSFEKTLEPWSWAEDVRNPIQKPIGIHHVLGPEQVVSLLGNDTDLGVLAGN